MKTNKHILDVFKCLSRKRQGLSNSFLCTQLLQRHKCTVFETFCTKPAALEATWHSPFSVQVVGRKNERKAGSSRIEKYHTFSTYKVYFHHVLSQALLPTPAAPPPPIGNTVLGRGWCTVKICSPLSVPLSFPRFTQPNLKQTFRCKALSQIHCRM